MVVSLILHGWQFRWPHDRHKFPSRGAASSARYRLFLAVDAIYFTYAYDSRREAPPFRDRPATPLRAAIGRANALTPSPSTLRCTHFFMQRHENIAFRQIRLSRLYITRRCAPSSGRQYTPAVRDMSYFSTPPIRPRMSPRRIIFSFDFEEQEHISWASLLAREMLPHGRRHCQPLITTRMLMVGEGVRQNWLLLRHFAQQAARTLRQVGRMASPASLRY